MPSPFFVQEKEKRETRKKNSFKAETIIRLPPTSKCYYFSHSRRLKFKYFSCRPTMAADNAFQCSMDPTFLNLNCTTVKKNGGYVLISEMLCFTNFTNEVHKLI